MYIFNENKKVIKLRYKNGSIFKNKIFNLRKVDREQNTVGGLKSLTIRHS